jgi:ABC-2 type transport system permease protein
MYNFKHSYDRITDAFYWPALDLLLWGLTGYYFASINKDAVSAVTTVITGMVFWIILWRAQYEVTINLLTELWDKNLINLFGSPLTFSEWIISVMIVGIVKGLMSFLFAAGLAYLLYHINIFVLGWYVPLFIALLFLSGWSIGFLVSSTIFQYGTRIQTLGWSFVWLFAPFAAVYYPLDILPQWAQVIAKTLPASYVFEQIRSLLLNGTVSWTQLGISLILNIIYLTISLLLIRKSFTILKKKGLAKLY